MTVKELCCALDAKAICLPDGEREVTGAYTGDLLSWVMGRAEADSAWVTIMSNVNVVAVASLADVACVILAEDVDLDAGVAEKAQTQRVNLLASPLTSYEVCAKLASLI